MKWIRFITLLGGLLGSAIGLHAQQFCNANIPASTPSAEFTDHGNGTVTHNRTGLMWQRCAEGQFWSAGTCAGSAIGLNWSGALQASVSARSGGYSDWRLPNIMELQSIVEEKCSNPSVNENVFPNTPVSDFWSASADASYSDYAWLVSFYHGGSITFYKNYDYGYQVRLVRGGQFFDNFGVVGPIATVITPTVARLDVPQDFTITGTGLTSGMAFTIEDCEPESGPGAIPEVGTGTTTQRTFRCVPRLPGPKLLTFKTAPSGSTVFSTTVNIDHPARLGNASSRGIPAVQGVSLWNGNVHLQATDLAVPGKGVSFALTRSYNSYSWGYEDSRGGVSNAAPWRFNWDLKLGYVAGTGNKQIWVEREDGSGENFFKDTDGLWYPMDQGNFNQIKGDVPEAGQTTLLTREGLKYIFQNPDQGGLLIKILDHDGNGLTISRDASNRVASVTDASSRPYIFTYDTNGRLFQVKSDTDGRTVQYTWEEQASPAAVLLKTVRDVRGKTTIYNYSLNTSTRTTNKPTDQWLLTSITDPNGHAAATPYAARTFTYSDGVYGNWGAASITDAQNNTWSFGYCAKPASGACQIDPTAAQSFQTTVTPPLGSAKITRFDTSGRLLEQVVQASTSATPKTSKTTPFDIIGKVSKNYNLAALTTQRQSALGVTDSYATAYDYTPDDAGNLATQTVPVLPGVNAVTTRAWNADAQAAARLANNLHRATGFTDAEGNATASTFNTSGNLLTHKPPGLAATELGYTAGLVTSVKDALGQTTDRDYDTHGNLTTVTDPLIAGASKRLSIINTYYPTGQLWTSTDKGGLLTTYTWDEAGNLASTKNTVDGVDNLVQHVYDPNGNRSQTIDAMGNVTKFTYDRNNRLKTVEKRIPGKASIITTTHYDALGRTTSTVNGNNHASTTTLDDLGNVLTRANALPFPSVTQYTYDDDNRVTQTVDPEGRITRSTYDRVGHVKTVTTGFGTTAALTTSYDYDRNGRMVKMTDPRSNITQYGYDGAGRLTSLTDAEGGITQATYDDNGNLRTVKDPAYSATEPAKHTTTYTYDVLNRPLTRTDANGQEWKTTYDASGNIVAQSVPGASGPKVTRFEYDTLNRLKKVTYPDASVVSYTYDKNSNRQTMTDSSGTTSYSYDALNRLTSKTDTLTGKTVGYTYDGAGNVKTLTYPGNQVLTYNYDEAERLSSLQDWLGKTTSYTLNQAGQVTAALFGNGSTVARVFDASGRQTSLINKQPGGTVISSHALTLDGNGNITDSTVQVPLPPALPNVNRAFTYDGANRLATVQFNAGDTPAAVTHDLAGRISGLGGDSYSYNDRDQVTGIIGAHSASYIYNGAGHRLARTLGVDTTRFVIDANRSLPEVLTETDGAGNVLRHYVYGYGLVSQIDAAGKAKYYHFDPTGSTLALSDAAGAVTDIYAYTPYGETTASGTTVNPFRYVGKLGVMDDGNGLHFMRARYYRADVGRFLSLDQLQGSPQNPQTLNRYAYATGNPVMGVDPSGLCDTKYSSCPSTSTPQSNYSVADPTYSLSAFGISGSEGSVSILDSISLSYGKTGTMKLSNVLPTMLKKGKVTVRIKIDGVELPSVQSVNKVGLINGAVTLGQFGLDLSKPYSKAIKGEKITDIEGQSELLRITTKTELSVISGTAFGAGCLGLAGVLAPTTAFVGTAITLTVCAVSGGLVGEGVGSWGSAAVPTSTYDTASGYFGYTQSNEAGEDFYNAYGWLIDWYYQ